MLPIYPMLQTQASSVQVLGEGVVALRGQKVLLKILGVSEGV